MTRSEDGLAKRRARLWNELQLAVRRTPALAAYAGRPLRDLPVTDVADLRSDYGRWNSLGKSHESLHAAALDAENGGTGEVCPGVVCGYSTGSGGTRGLFVADRNERADYVGQILARALQPSALLKPMRLALILRANSRLYSDSAGRRRSFLHLPLDLTPAETADSLERFSPTVLIAPAAKLVTLAAHGLRLPDLKRLFYGAEPMSGGERSWLESVLGLRPDPIYQATEGFIAIACDQGRLHLNEHSLDVELEPAPGTGGFRPILTDLRRRNQPIVRIRTDDLIELDCKPCHCGYAGRAIHPVMGRISEVLRYPGCTVSPARLMAAMDALAPPPLQWQVIGHSDAVELRLGPGGAQDQVVAGLNHDLGLPVPVRLSTTPPDAPAPKRRRIIVHG